MFKMGKFDRRGRDTDLSSFDNCLGMTSSSKVGFKPKKHLKHSPYSGDPHLVPRINQYLADNKDKVYVDINDMVNDLQSRYKDYGRRKRSAFKQLVEKAFAVVLEQCGMGPGESMNDDQNYVESTENSSSDVEECNIVDNEDSSVITSSNNQLLNLYKSSQLQSKQFQQSNASAELIDLSSDDENKKKDDSGEKEEPAVAGTAAAVAAATISTNGLQNHVFPRDTSFSLVPGNTPKPGVRLSIRKAERERPYVTIVRKRKSLNQGDKSLHSTKKKKEASTKEPQVTFADFGGNPKVLEEVCKLILHIQHPEIYKQIGASPPRGFLLHGPPGCGKTLLATAIAGELEVPLIKVSAPELVGGVSGESEERIRELFDKAVENAPCVLFIDEVDAVTPNRQNAQREMERRIVAQLLGCLDDLNNKPNGEQVLVVGATNRPDSLDPALRRAGRFDKEVCLGIPDQKAREQILRVLCKNFNLAPNFSFEDLAVNTPGYVGADLLALTREAASAAINRAFGALHQTDKNKTKKKKKKEITIVTEKEVAKEVSSLSENKKAEETMEIDVIEDEKKKPEETSASLASDEKKDQSPQKTGDNEVQNVESKINKEDGKDEGKKEEKKEDSKEDKKEEKAAESENKTEEEKKETEKKADSDMDIAETVSEESVNCESKDVEVCNEKTAASDESDIEILPESWDSSPPTLDTLLMLIHSASPLSQRQLKNLCLTQEDFNKALKCVQPSAKREGFATVPDVTWDDVGSLADIREELQMSILGSVKYRKQFEKLDLTTPTGILICGPPGCGKTLLAKAVANEAGINFISVKGPELLNMYVGESERAVRQCFQRARNSAPCVIFFDELDALCPRRSDSGDNGASMRVVNQMLTEMDGVEDRKEVYLMAATNRPDIIDPAVLRPGRLDKILYVGLPEASDRIDILRALTKNGTKPKLAENVNLTDIANRPECDGYSGADLALLVREAKVQALKDLIRNKECDANGEIPVTLEHFERALKTIRPSVSEQDKKRYESVKKKFTLTPHI